MCEVADYPREVRKNFGINFRTPEIASASLQAPLSKHWSGNRRVCWTCSAPMSCSESPCISSTTSTLTHAVNCMQLPQRIWLYVKQFV